MIKIQGNIPKNHIRKYGKKLYAVDTDGIWYLISTEYNMADDNNDFILHGYASDMVQEYFGSDPMGYEEDAEECPNEEPNFDGRRKEVSTEHRDFPKFNDMNLSFKEKRKIVNEFSPDERNLAMLQTLWKGGSWVDVARDNRLGQRKKRRSERDTEFSQKRRDFFAGITRHDIIEKRRKEKVPGEIGLTGPAGTLVRIDKNTKTTNNYLKDMWNWLKDRTTRDKIKDAFEEEKANETAEWQKKVLENLKSGKAKRLDNEFDSQDPRAPMSRSSSYQSTPSPSSQRPPPPPPSALPPRGGPRGGLPRPKGPAPKVSSGGGSTQSSGRTWSQWASGLFGGGGSTTAAIGAAVGATGAVAATGLFDGPVSDTHEGLRLSSNEAIGGGNTKPGTFRLGHILQGRSKYVKDFSAFSDEYHVKRNPNSKHNDGYAIDVRMRGVTPGKHNYSEEEKEISRKATDEIREIMKSLGIPAKPHGNMKYGVLNELLHPSGHATGPHIHVQFENKEIYDAFLKATDKLFEKKVKPIKPTPKVDAKPKPDPKPKPAPKPMARNEGEQVSSQSKQAKAKVNVETYTSNKVINTSKKQETASLGPMGGVRDPHNKASQTATL